MKIIETPDSWKIQSPELHVSRCIVDYQFSLDLMNSQGKVWMSVTIENDFEITQNGVETSIIIENPVSVGPALVLFGKRLLEGQMCKNGNLKLEFSDDLVLYVKPDEMYESWNVYFHDAKSFIDGTRFVCMPRGEIAYWSNNSHLS